MFIAGWSMTEKTVFGLLTVTRTFVESRRKCPVKRWFLSVSIFEGGEKMTNYELMMELTCDGDCDRCMFGLMGDCHLQCTHIEEPDEEIEE